ncbi:signal peptidase I [Nocardioides sp. Y6]|uniref:Signal peptidase I n=1 Tax=Nocardioides malaquae TaxID=2773426 RepID=A0ABR9RTD5_9ACTN|nr:signal peptidase I [Nocardioides malaquae]MBE7324850.1 signal peptidase I [Nocardioides malaquae]
MALPSSQTTREWAVFTVVVGSRVYRAMLLTLVAIAAAPMLLGWHPYVIKSGSMEPSIAVGDVALGRPFAADEKIAVGRVYMFDDPSVAEERILVHRVVELRDDHTYTTAGDANGATDVTPITPDDVEARAILLVPYVGLPVTWLQTGRWVPLGIWLALTMAAFLLATRNVDGEPPKWTMRRLILDGLRRDTAAPGDGGTTTEGREGVLVRGGRSLAGLVAVCLVATTAFGTANAAFSGTTRNSGNTFTATSALLPYVAAVLADSPRGFWLLDETSGTTVRDYSQTYPNGPTSPSFQWGAPGALPRNPGTAMSFSGGRAILNNSAIGVPNAYSYELWFRTTSTSGGYLIGFENSTGANSGVADRTLLMTESGQLIVGEWLGLSRGTVTTPRSYNDGQWHQVVVTAAARSSFRQAVTIYVDGQQVASGSATAGGTLLISSGHWRIGEGNVDTNLFGTGTNVAFRGDLDAVSIYDRVLSAARVRAHWDAR